MMNDLPRSKFSQEYEYLDKQHNEFYRKTSFSIVKHTTYSKTEDAQRHVKRLEKLKIDKFSGRIKIPYFEFKVKQNTLIIQSEFIKGRPLSFKNELTYIYENIVCRPSSWSFLDCNTSNFIVDDHGYKDNISSPIYIVDLDSYKECSVEERKKRWRDDMLSFPVPIWKEDNI